MKRNKAKRGRAPNGAGRLVKHGKYYHARWWVNGKEVSRSTGTDNLAEAREWLARQSVVRTGMRDRDAVAKLARAIAVTLDDADALTKTVGIPVARLAELYESEPSRREVAAVTMDGYRQQLAILAAWVSRRYPEIVSARDISQTVADGYAAERAKEVSANRLNKDLNLFTKVWRTLARKYGLDYNPWSADHIARRRHRAVERRALTDEEVRALLDNSTGEIHLMILLGISTGLRLGDIRNLRWADHVDMERKEIAIRRTQKTGAPVVLPMTRELFRALREASMARSGEWVLEGQHGRGTDAVCRSVAAVFRRAGIAMRPDGTKTPVASFHSLRHTFVSRLMRRGISPALIQAAVGHSTMMMTEHYTHITADELRRGLAETRRRTK